MDFSGVPLVTEDAANHLNKKQLLDYREHREAFLSWLLVFGKDPESAAGYSRATVRRTAYRIDQFYRRVWSQEGTYTTSFSHEHADGYMKELASSEKSNTYKSNM